MLSRTVCGGLLVSRTGGRGAGATASGVGAGVGAGVTGAAVGSGTTGADVGSGVFAAAFTAAVATGLVGACDRHISWLVRLPVQAEVSRCRFTAA